MSNARPNKKDFQDESPKNREGIKRRDVLISSGSLLAASALMGEALNTATSRAARAQANAAKFLALPSDQIGEVATSAYVYAYPLILIELTRRVATNVADTRQFTKAPINQFANVPAFPDATFTDIVRPNADTLYSLLWFDVSQEPLLISVPDSGGATICSRCATCGLTCSTARASARPGQARRCWRSRGRAGKVNSLQKLRSSIAPRRSAGSSGARRPTAKLTTKPCTNSRPD